MPGRRHSTLKEQLIPCEACGYPMSYRHHILSFAEFGDTEATVRLCPNCHYLYHVIERVDRAWSKNKFDTKAEKMRVALENALHKAGREDVINFLLDLTTEAWHAHQNARQHPEMIIELTRHKRRR